MTSDDISPSVSSISVGDELVRMMETSDAGITVGGGGEGGIVRALISLPEGETSSGPRHGQNRGGSKEKTKGRKQKIMSITIIGNCNVGGAAGREKYRLSINNTIS